MSVRVAPKLVERRIRMLTNHIKNPTLRPKRRAKMKQELEVLLRIKELYEKQRTQMMNAAMQKRLEEVAPELKSALESQDEVHRVAMLPSVLRTEEKKE